MNNEDNDNQYNRNIELPIASKRNKGNNDNKSSSDLDNTTSITNPEECNKNNVYEKDKFKDDSISYQNNEDNGNRTDVYMYSPLNDAGVKYRSVGAKDVEVKLLKNLKLGGYKVYQKFEGLALSGAEKVCGKDSNNFSKFESAIAINVEAKKGISKRRKKHGKGKANRVTEEQNTVEFNGEQWL